MPIFCYETKAFAVQSCFCNALDAQYFFWYSFSTVFPSESCSVIVCCSWLSQPAIADLVQHLVVTISQ